MEQRFPIVGIGFASLSCAILRLVVRRPGMLERPRIDRARLRQPPGPTRTLSAAAVVRGTPCCWSGARGCSPTNVARGGDGQPRDAVAANHLVQLHSASGLATGPPDPDRSVATSTITVPDLKKNLKSLNDRRTKPGSHF